MATVHERLFGEPTDANVSLKATADVIKPVFQYPSHLIDEMKVRFEEDRIGFDAVDPANVAMVGMTVPAGVFENYESGGAEHGMNISTVKSALRAGRKSEGDVIKMETAGTRMQTAVKRDYAGTQMDLCDDLRLIDPDSIRDEPEMPDLDFEAEATVPRKAFEAGLEQVDKYSDAMELRNVGSDLVLSKPGAAVEERNEEDEEDYSGAILRDVVDADEDVCSWFSLDYLKDSTKAFAAVGADELTIKFGDEIPIEIHFSKEVNGEEITGYWSQAPRIKPE